MHRALVLVALLSVMTARRGAAQRIPLTLAEANSEGAAAAHGDVPARTARAFRQGFDGTSNRTCVNPTSSNDAGTGSLRSGDIIIRARLSGDWRPRANRDYKILWFPLHNPFEYPDTLLIRAVRLGDASDTLRLSVPHWAWATGAPKTESGFPSLVRFPSPGNWLVVATAGPDWGCFVLNVAGM